MRTFTTALWAALSLVWISTEVSAQSSGGAQPAIISSWILNTTGQTGYSGLPSNIQRVEYSDSNVYVSCSCIPGYDIGPWKGNPNVPKNESFLFKLPRYPRPNLLTRTATPGGHIGVWSNGVSIFNAKDARSYNNAGIWNQNAIVVEGSSFDECLGHPAPNGEYHHHLNPVCLYNQKDSTHHSPIIGYAFDGYPIYGSYGFDKTDGTGTPRRMRSSYRMRNITERTTLPDGTTVAASNAGPAVSAQYPLGYYIEDFEYVQGLGDLDENNGRFCVTPEYPAGTYAYFVTVDSNDVAAYPYTFGPNYYGVVTAADLGPGSGHVTITESVLNYVPTNGVDQTPEVQTFTLHPNPASDYVIADYTSTVDHATHIDMWDERGVPQMNFDVDGPTSVIQLSSLAHGTYYISLETSSGRRKLMKFIRE